MVLLRQKRSSFKSCIRLNQQNRSTYNHSREMILDNWFSQINEESSVAKIDAETSICKVCDAI